jgi:hypothetical protein
LITECDNGIAARTPLASHSRFVAIDPFGAESAGAKNPFQWALFLGVLKLTCAVCRAPVTQLGVTVLLGSDDHIWQTTFAPND